MTALLAAFLRALIYCYRYGISPLLMPSCRYQPTCSAYALQAIRAHGPFRGGALAVGRVARCHPWGGSGYDPVPRPLATRGAGTDRGRGPGPCPEGHAGDR